MLCGSDYNEGVHGVGKESAMKFMNRHSDEEILDYIRSWRKNDQKYKELENKITDKKICTSCGISILLHYLRYILGCISYSEIFWASQTQQDKSTATVLPCRWYKGFLSQYGAKIVQRYWIPILKNKVIQNQVKLNFIFIISPYFIVL